MKDKLYSNKLLSVSDFKFNRQVAGVFDNMILRSIPFYNQIHQVLLDIIKFHVPANELIYDLGCSTGTTIVLIQKKFPEKNFNIIGCDNSKEMLKKCRSKLKKDNIEKVKLKYCDIENIILNKCNAVLLNYTLQFIPIKKRLKLLKNIYKSLNKNGVIFISEKIKSDQTDIDRLQVDLYHQFKKRNGYSNLEISQKREALENILTPITFNNQLELLKKSGFKKVDLIFKWYNFASFIGIK